MIYFYCIKQLAGLYIKKKLFDSHVYFEIDYLNETESNLIELQLEEGCSIFYLNKPLS